MAVTVRIVSESTLTRLLLRLALVAAMTRFDLSIERESLLNNPWVTISRYLDPDLLRPFSLPGPVADASRLCELRCGIICGFE